MKTRIKDLREDHDLTQKELSKFLNISQVAYSYYELNRRNIPLELLAKLADYYHTSVDFIRLTACSLPSGTGCGRSLAFFQSPASSGPSA